MTVNSTEDIIKKLLENKTGDRMPLLFVGHGNPMNAVLDNQFSRAWKEIGTNLPTPNAIVVLSAHWPTHGSYITAMPKPKMIYDFYGFPPEMYQLQYPAPGEPKLANQISQMVKGMQSDHEWGLDHGAWSVLIQMFPDPTIPVLQMSIDYDQSPEEQFRTIQEIRSLREKGVMFIGSGNIVHNLREVRMDNIPYDWSIEFDQLSKGLLSSGDYDRLIHYEKLGSIAKMAIPHDDHYRPMLLTLGLTYADESPLFFNEEIDAGSVSMRSFLMSR